MDSREFQPFNKDLENLYVTVRDGKLYLGLQSVEIFTEKGEQAFHGSGFLDQSSSGDFCLRLMVVATDMNWVASINRAIPQDSIIRFRFVAIDEAGKRWQNGLPVRPYLGNLSAAYDNAMRGDPFQIVIQTPALFLDDISEYLTAPSKESDGESSFCEFVIPEKFGIPTPHRHKESIDSTLDGKTEKHTFDHFSTMVGDLRFRLREPNHRGYFLGSVFGNPDTFPPFIDQKVLQVLMFLSAAVFDYPISLRRTANQSFIRLRGSSPSSTSSIPTPVTSERFWPAFEAALSYLIAEDSDGVEFHPSFAAAINLMYAGFGTKVNHDLGISVAIETALSNCHLADAEEGDVLSDDSIKKIRGQVNSLELDENVGKRIDGMLSNLSRWSAADRLYKLNALGHVTEEQIKAWKRVRHRTAHGSTATIGNAEYGHLYTLLNKIVLVTVGFFEESIDYGEEWAE